MDKWKVLKTIEETGIVAIVRGIKVEEISPIAAALYEGGIRVIEVTCNTKGYLRIIETLSDQMENRMLVGAGTVLNPTMAQMVLDAGATFVLAPDFNPDVIIAVHEKQKLVIPGVATPTEIIQAHRLGVDLVKVFPAGALGARYIKEIRGPLGNAAVLPVGGINLGNIKEFAQVGAYAVGVGGELVDKKAIEQGNYNVLTQHAKDFIAAFMDGKNSQK